MSTRSARRGAAVVASGLLLSVVPGLVSGEVANAATPTAISITASPASPVAGSSFSLTARLGVANKRVTFSEKVAGSTSHVIFSDTTDAAGNLGITGVVKYNASYTASFAGDAAYGSSTATTSVKVRAKVSIKDTGGKKKNGFRQYKANSKAKTTVKVAPSKTGKKVTFRLQKFVKGKWKTLGKKTVKLKKGSKVSLSHVGFAGSSFRIRVEYRGDKLNAKNVSKWNYQIFV